MKIMYDKPPVTVAVFIILLIINSAVCSEEGQQKERDILAGTVDSLKSEARFEEALPFAVELMEIIKSDSSAFSYEKEDAERLVMTIRFLDQLPDSSQNKILYADSLSDVYFSLYSEGAYGEALEKADEQLRLRKEVYAGDHPDIAQSMNNIGFLLAVLEKFNRAESMYSKALEMDRRMLGEMHPDVATDYNNLGGLLHNTGHLDKADSLYRKALDIYKRLEGDNSPNVAMCLSNIASIYKERGDFFSAEPMFRRALLIYRRLYGDVDCDVAYALHNLATFLVEKGDRVQAEALFKEAVDIYRQLPAEYELDLAITLNGLASLLQDREDYHLSRKYYLESLEICRKLLGEEHGYVAEIISNLADLHHDLGDYERADSLFTKALDIQKELHGGYHRNVAIMTLNLARNTRDKGNYEGAIPEYMESLSLFREIMGERHPYTAMCLYSYGNCLIADGNFSKAEEILSEAVDVYEASRARMESGIEQAEFQNSPYPKLARCYLAQKKSYEAWKAVESHQGRILAELIINSGKRELTPAEMEREESLKQDLIDRERKLYALRSDSGDESAKVEEHIRKVRNEILDIETEWYTFQKKLSEKYPMKQGVSYPLAKIRKSIPEKSVIIGWLDIEERENQYSSWVYLIKKKGDVLWARCGNSRRSNLADPFENSEKFITAISNPNSAEMGLKYDAKKIYSKFFGNISEALDDIEHLIIIPSGAMLGVPVGFLADEEGEYLCDRFTISYAPSATIYSWLKESHDIKDKSGNMSLLIGDPPFNENHIMSEVSEEANGEVVDKPAKRQGRYKNLRGVLDGDESALKALPRLDATRREVNEISKISPEPIILLGKNATEQNLAAMNEEGTLEKFSYIHIATHALIDDIRPQRSALVLSQVGLADPVETILNNERFFDGLVSTREILNEWKLSAKLVTLSACETGLGKRLGGEGYIGFSYAFFQAGAKSLLVSLWKVEDNATYLMMKYFYEFYFGKGEGEGNTEISGGMSKAEALKKAKKKLRDYSDNNGYRPYTHPFFWAAFILIGED